jgi:hypothetical protein
MANKTFKESQPEGALKESFFDKVPDPYQISNYLKNKKDSKMRNTKLIEGDKGEMLQANTDEMRKQTSNTDMKGGNRDPKAISKKDLMSKIAKSSEFNTSKTMPGKNSNLMKKISDDSKMAKPTSRPDSVKKKAKKAPIVTKKMLDDSGYTNLRDYMNAKQGKTRKDGKAASRTTAAKNKDMMGEFKAGGKVMGYKKGGKVRGAGIARQGVRPTKYI